MAGVRGIFDPQIHGRLIAVRVEFGAQHRQVLGRIVVGVRRAVRAQKRVPVTNPLQETPRDRESQDCRRYSQRTRRRRWPGRTRSAFVVTSASVRQKVTVNTRL